MGEEIFTFLRESMYSVSLITVPFCPVTPCPFQILAGVLQSMSLPFLQLSLLKWSFKCHAQEKGAFGFSEINVFLIILT